MGLLKYLLFLLVLVAIGFIVYACCWKSRLAQRNSQLGQVPVSACESKVQTYDAGISAAYPPPTLVEVSQDLPMAAVVDSDLPIAQPLPSGKTEGDVSYYR